jgi:RimJ/RimL family protein N-acetyltransferase
MSITADVIRAGRLTLVPLRAGHADEMAGVLADPDLYAFTGGSPPSVADLRSRYERWVAGSPDPAASWCNWVIQLHSPRCLAGTVQATIGVGGDRPSAEVAWVIGTRWQGRGLGTEAARALVGWLQEQSVSTVVAHIHPRHLASAAVAAAAGLTPTDDWHDGERMWTFTITAEPGSRQ